ncbi:MAG: hypothetical protein V1740_06155 [Candidatus Woesearchaeota archaeon]
MTTKYPEGFRTNAPADLYPDQALIMGVCTANQGRSQPFEATGNIRLAELGMLDRYRCVSSGSSVDDIANDRTPVSVKERFVRMALKDHNVYDPEQVKRLDQALRNGDDDIINELYPLTEEHFQNEEHAWRDIWRQDASNRYGIKIVFKQEPEQTVARPNVVAVLPMAQRNLDAVQAIYDAQEAQYPPVFEVLPVFIPGVREKQATDCFGGRQEEYLNCVKQVEIWTRMAVDEIVDMNL